MVTRFVHCSDLHLGYNQFQEEERFRDFGLAFANIVDFCIDRHVDYLIIAGDIFNKRSINAKTLTQAIELFKRLKNADIPVVVIEGNHDKAPYGEGDSWMSFLNQQGYFHLLSPSFEQGQLVLNPWDPTTCTGNLLVKSGIRFIGLGYLGSMAARRIEELNQILLPSNTFTVLLLHSAVDRLMHLGGISLANLKPLTDRVDYIAMGHVHEQYEVENWVYNPGSPECWDLGESEKSKGFFYVEVEGKNKRVEHIPSLRRPVVNVRVDVTEVHTPEQVNQMIIEELKTTYHHYPMKPIIRVIIQGILPFNPLALDQSELAVSIKEHYPCLTVEIVNNAVLEGGLNVSKGQARVEREALEEQVLRQLVKEYGKVPQNCIGSVVNVAQQIKELVMTAEDQDDQQILALIDQLVTEMEQVEKAELAVLSIAATTDGGDVE